MADDAGAVAALDCGTNSTRLLIAGGRGEILAREMRITRLGEDVDATHKLSADAIARTVAVLRAYKQMMDDHGVTRARRASVYWRNVSQSDIWPLSSPRLNHAVRCAEVPCVKDSGLT